MILVLQPREMNMNIQSIRNYLYLEFKVLFGNFFSDWKQVYRTQLTDVIKKITTEHFKLLVGIILTFCCISQSRMYLGIKSRSVLVSIQTRLLEKFSKTFVLDPQKAEKLPKTKLKPFCWSRTPCTIGTISLNTLVNAHLGLHLIISQSVVASTRYGPNRNI